MTPTKQLLAQIHALSAEPEDDELGLGPSWQLEQIREALGMKHVWIPVSECGELADGRYRCILVHTLPDWDQLSPEEQWARRVAGKWNLMFGLEVTHVLSPFLGPMPLRSSLGPIPEGTR